MKHLLLATIAAVQLVGCGPLERPFFSLNDAAEEGNVAAVKKYLAEGADTNRQAGQWGNTPLHEAAFWGHVEIVKLLTREEVDVDAKDYYGCTPLHDAAEYGHLEIAELLINKATDVNARAEDGNTPLDLASGKIADLLRKHGGKKGAELRTEDK